MASAPHVSGERSTAGEDPAASKTHVNSASSSNPTGGAGSGMQEPYQEETQNAAGSSSSGLMMPEAHALNLFMEAANYLTTDTDIQWSELEKSLETSTSQHQRQHETESSREHPQEDTLQMQAEDDEQEREAENGQVEDSFKRPADWEEDVQLLIGLGQQAQQMDVDYQHQNHAPQTASQGGGDQEGGAGQTHDSGSGATKRKRPARRSVAAGSGAEASSSADHGQSAVSTSSKRRAPATPRPPKEPSVKRTKRSPKPPKPASEPKNLLSAAQKRANHVSSEQRRRNAIKIGYAELAALQIASVNEVWAPTEELVSMAELAPEHIEFNKTQMKGTLGQKPFAKAPEIKDPPEEPSPNSKRKGAGRSRPALEGIGLDKGTSKATVLQKAAAMAEWLTRGNEYLQNRIRKMEEVLGIEHQEYDDAQVQSHGDYHGQSQDDHDHREYQDDDQHQGDDQHVGVEDYPTELFQDGAFDSAGQQLQDLDAPDHRSGPETRAHHANDVVDQENTGRPLESQG